MANLELNSESIDEKRNAFNQIAHEAFTAWRDHVTKLDGMKKEAEDVLVSARTEANQILSDAKNRAEIILSHAKTRAAELVSGVEQEVSEHEETQTAKYITAAEEYKKEYLAFRDTHKLNDALLTIMGYPPIVKGVLSRSAVVKLFKQKRAEETPLEVTSESRELLDSEPVESNNDASDTTDTTAIDESSVEDTTVENSGGNHSEDSRPIWKRRA